MYIPLLYFYRLLSESTKFQTLSQTRTTVWDEVDRGVGESRGETHGDAGDDLGCRIMCGGIVHLIPV